MDRFIAGMCPLLGFRWIYDLYPRLTTLSASQSGERRFTR